MLEETEGADNGGAGQGFLAGHKRGASDEAAEENTHSSGSTTNFEIAEGLGAPPPDVVVAANGAVNSGDSGDRNFADKAVASAGEVEVDIFVEHHVDVITRDHAKSVAAAPSLSSGVANLTNYIIGAGILGLSFAFSASGYVFGPLLLIIIALATVLSYFLLIWASHSAHAYSYEALARAAAGECFSTFIKIFIIIDSFGALSAYQIIIGSSLLSVVKFAGTLEPGSVFLSQQFLSFLCVLFVIIPLCFLRRIEKLEFTSWISLLPLVYLFVFQVVHLSRHGTEPNPAWNAGPAAAKSFFSAFPIFVFAYSSQQAVFPIYSEMKDKGGTKRDLRKLILISMGLTFVAYLVCGLLGYAAFPKSAQGNVMDAYPDSVALAVLKALMGLSVLLSYPIIVFPCRYSVDRLLFPRRSEDSYVRFVAENIVIVLVAYAIASAIPSFSTLLGIFGAVTSTTIGYILPSYFMLRLVPGVFRADKRKWLAVLLLVCGSAAGIASLASIIAEKVECGSLEC